MDQDYSPVTIEGEDRPRGIITLCDHATNIVPPDICGGDLGLPAPEMARHIAYDVGALGLSRHLARLIDGPLVHSNFSRLVIDPNRGEDDPTLLMHLYDGTIIPGNRDADAHEEARRRKAYYRPYHRAIEDLARQAADPVLISVHSFTPQLKARAPRPWHVGVLYAGDTRLAHPLINRLTAEGDICVGDNEPYSGHLTGDTMDRHGVQQRRLHVLIELRNDLIETTVQQRHWAERLAPILAGAVEDARKEHDNG